MKNEVVDAAYELQKTYPGLTVQSAIDVIQGQRLRELLNVIASALIDIEIALSSTPMSPIHPELEGLQNLAKAAKAKR